MTALLPEVQEEQPCVLPQHVLEMGVCELRKNVILDLFDGFGTLWVPLKMVICGHHLVADFEVCG